MKKQLLPVAIAVCLTVGVTGCALDQMSKQDIGTGIGVLAGAVIGNKVGDGGAAGIAIGAAVGGFLGNRIGAHLDEEDRKALAAQTAQNLETLKTGEAMTWKSDRTGSTATVQVSEAKDEQKQIDIPTASAITVPANVKLVQKTYQATKDTTIYTQTSNSSNIVGTLGKNKTTNVMGKTEDGQWLLVSRKGVLVGFVSANNLKVYTPPAPAVKTAQATTVKPAAPSVAVADLDAMPSKEVTKSTKTAAFDLDAIDVKKQSTTASVECKTLTYDIKTKDNTSQETGKACKTPNGTWDLG